MGCSDRWIDFIPQTCGLCLCGRRRTSIMIALLNLILGAIVALFSFERLLHMLELYQMERDMYYRQLNWHYDNHRTFNVNGSDVYIYDVMDHYAELTREDRATFHYERREPPIAPILIQAFISTLDVLHMTLSIVLLVGMWKKSTKLIKVWIMGFVSWLIVFSTLPATVIVMYLSSRVEMSEREKDYYDREFMLLMIIPLIFYGVSFYWLAVVKGYYVKLNQELTEGVQPYYWGYRLARRSPLHPESSPENVGPNIHTHRSPVEPGYFILPTVRPPQDTGGA